jgi:hypothetical protein
MKRELAKLSRVEREKVELAYHRKQPKGFDGLMAGAKPHSPDVIRLPQRLVETLKSVAKSEGEPEYKDHGKKMG